MSETAATPENVGKVLIKHACGHEPSCRIRQPVGSVAAQNELAHLQQLACFDCREEKRRDKDRRRTEAVNRMRIATKLMAAFVAPYWPTPPRPNQPYSEMAREAVRAADCLLAALRERNEKEGQG